MSPGRDPRTPVVVGVGQAAERIDQPGYRALSAVALAAEAVRAALADTGADPAAVAAAADTVAGVRQFEISTPWATAPLGRSDNYPRSVALRVGADPGRAVLEVTGGQAPQHLVTEFAGEIAAGTADVVLLHGSEAISTVRSLAGSPEPPDHSEQVGGQLEDRGYGLDGLLPPGAVEHGLTSPAACYALYENARAARLGLGREAYAHSMGELFAPFTRVAAGNPYAAAPVERDAPELVTPTAANRLITEPYLRYLVARDQVNQGAAAVLMSVAAARRLGVPESRWVYLHGSADVRERDLLDRADLSRYPAAVLALRSALELAQVEVADLATLDLYSCFPVAVTALTDGLGIAPDDPRGLTLTGGLPFFGGAGNNYSMHAIAETVQRARARQGSTGLVGANGGMLSKYSVGVYSTRPTAWRPGDSASLQARIDAWPAPTSVLRADGAATIETWTVTHARDGARTGVVVGRLAEGGARFLARVRPEHLGLLEDGEPVGRPVQVTSGGSGNEVTRAG